MAVRVAVLCLVAALCADLCVGGVITASSSVMPPYAKDGVVRFDHPMSLEVVTGAPPHALDPTGA